MARTAGLGGLDSLLGAIFGVIRGCFLVVVAIIAIAAFMPQKTWLNGSKLAPYFLSAANQCGRGAGRVTPEDSRGSGNHQTWPRLDSIPLASSPSHALEH